MLIGIILTALLTVTVPPDIIEMSVEIGEQYDIYPELLQALAFRESSFNPEAANGDCKGLMQISETWHQDRMSRLGVTDLFDSYSSMLLAADYITELYEIYPDIGTVLMRYNGDANYMNYWLSDAPISAYANDIIEMSHELIREEDAKSESRGPAGDCLQPNIGRSVTVRKTWTDPSRQTY